MKEHEDDGFDSVKESTVTVDSATDDGIVTEKLGGGGEGKVEGFFGERDEGEDMMVDVVGTDVVVDGHGGTVGGLDSKEDSDELGEEGLEKETGNRDLVMEEVCDASVESRDLAFEKVEEVVNEGVKRSVEVSNEVLRGDVSGSDGDAQKSGNGTGVGGSELAVELLSGEPRGDGGEVSVIDGGEETERGMTEEIVERPVESVQEVADGDRVMDEKTGKEAEVLDSSKISESLTTKANRGLEDVDVVVVEDALAEKDEAQDSVSVDPSVAFPDNQNLLKAAVNEERGECAAHVDAENSDHQAEVDSVCEEESLHPTIGDMTTDAQNSGNETGVGVSKMDIESSSGEPQSIGGEVAVIDSKEETEGGLTEEITEQPKEFVHKVADGDRVMDEETGDESEVLDSSKIPDSSTTTADLSLQKVDVVVEKEGLAGKDESQDGVSVDPSLVCPDNQFLSTEVVNAGAGEGAVHLHAENSHQQAEVDPMSREESSHPTIEVIKYDVQKSGDGIGVGDSKMAVESSSGEPQSVGVEIAVTDKEEETESGLTEEIVERHPESVKEVVDGDGVMDEKIGKEDEALDSSKVPESLTTTANLRSEEVDVVVVEESLAVKDVAQDSVDVGPSSVCPDNRSSSTEMVNAGTGEGALHVNAENSDKHEVDPLRKEESSLPAIQVITADESQGSLHLTVEQVVNVKPADNSSESCATPSFLDTTEPFAGGRVQQIEHKAPSQSTVEASSEHHSSGFGRDDGGAMVTSAASVSSVSHSEVAFAADTKVSNLDSTENISVGGEVLTIDNNKVCDSGKNTDVVKAEELELQAVDESSKLDAASCPEADEVAGFPEVAACTESGEVAACTESGEVAAFTEAGEVAACPQVDEVTTTALEVPNSEVQVPSTGGTDGLVENQVLEVNAVTESSKPDVVAYTEPESCIGQTIPAIANEVREIDTGVQNCTVELPTSGDMSGVVEDQELKTEAVSTSDAAVCDVPGRSSDQFLLNSGNEVTAGQIEVPSSMVEVPGTGEMNGFQVSAEDFEEVNRETTCADDAEHGVQPADLEFSYDEAHVERGEDAGMDIDEVLGWKDEIPGIDDLSGGVGRAEKDQHLNSEADVEQGLLKSSCEPVLIGQQEEDPKFRQPIVYERRAHVEVPPDDAFGASSSPRVKEVERLCGNSDDSSVKKEEQNVVVLSTNPPSSNVMVNEEPSTLTPLDTAGGGNCRLEAHVNEAKDSSVSDKEHHSLPLVEDDSKLAGGSAYLHVSACLDERGADDLTAAGSLTGREVDVEEHSGMREHTDFCSEQETEALEHSSEAEQSTYIDEDVTEPLKNEASVSLHQSCYFQPPENEGEFSVSDLVWGKIRSHPWWPGQIFDPSDASEKAMKHHKKDCFLVAYFGDGTFAWNDSTVLKPFRANFSQIEKKHSNSEAFRNAVKCALEEVSRRVELGLACPCISRDILEKIEYQVVENGGIWHESSRRHGIDRSAGVSSFEPDKLVDYVRQLARFPYGEGDRMELAIAKAQLSSYGHYKGYRQLPEFQFCGDLLEDVSETPILGEVVEQVNKDGELVSDKSHMGGEYNTSQKFEDNLIDGAHSNTKERSLSEPVDETPYSGDGEDGAEGSVSSSGVKKRKALDTISDASEKRPSLHPEKVPPALTPTAKPSFKVGECIQRVASQLTGAPSVQKSSNDKKVEHADQPVVFSVSAQSSENSQRGRMGEGTSLAEMLSQLHLAAQDPRKGYSFLNIIIPFFASHRAAVLTKARRQNSSTGLPGGARKRKPSNKNDPEEFEFDDVNDSYWTDRIIQNYSEEQLLQDNQNGGGEYQLVAYEADKPVKPTRRSNKKRFFSSNHEIEADEQLQLVERRRQNLATEIVLKFAEGIHFPSEMNLNKMFRRFGPLMESETEVDRQQGRARVVFKKCSDAEVAHSSAGKFNIFGSINVNYELNYTPLVSYKPLPPPMFQDPEYAS